MIDHWALRWALTAVFAVAAVGFIGTGRTTGRHGAWALHALASVAMIAMVWPVGMQIPSVLYLLVFTACALYFAYLALFDSGLAHPVYHCTMMGAMALMGLLMAPNTATPAAGAAPEHHDHMAHMTTTHNASVQNPGWFIAVCAVLAVGFGGATLWWFYLLVRGPQRPYADLLMALGMSAAFAAMTT